MAASAPTLPASLKELVLDFEDAYARLLGAQHGYTSASDAVAACKAQLETLRAERLASGVEGKNADEREARLRLCLAEPHEKLYQAERLLSLARLELDAARLEWDWLRYRLRAFEVAAGPCNK